MLNVAHDEADGLWLGEREKEAHADPEAVCVALTLKLSETVAVATSVSDALELGDALEQGDCVSLTLVLEDRVSLTVAEDDELAEGHGVAVVL